MSAVDLQHSQVSTTRESRKKSTARARDSRPTPAPRTAGKGADVHLVLQPGMRESAPLWTKDKWRPAPRAGIPGRHSLSFPGQSVGRECRPPLWSKVAAGNPGRHFGPKVTAATDSSSCCEVVRDAPFFRLRSRSAATLDQKWRPILFPAATLYQSGGGHSRPPHFALRTFRRGLRLEWRGREWRPTLFCFWSSVVL